ncbi:MAG: lamin tail domain-containing protein [Nanoarchaeota archaeon]
MKLSYILLIIIVLVVSVFSITYSGCFVDITESSRIVSQDLPEELIDELNTATLNAEETSENAEESIEKVILEEPTTCPDSCDDGNLCTRDYCSEETGFECAHLELAMAECVCGTNCDDENPCTSDICEKRTKECKHVEMDTCCSDGTCDEDETYESCPEDCIAPEEEPPIEPPEEEPEKEPPVEETEIIVEIISIQWDAPEWVEIINNGDDVDMMGWTLVDAANHDYIFPAFTLLSGASIKVHNVAVDTVIEDTATDLYWNGGANIWNNGGDTATLSDSVGTVINEYTY